MPFILRRESEIHACLTSALDEEFHLLGGPDDVTAAANALLDLAQRASREFRERWNERRSKIQLPPEVLAECFQCLDVPGRVAASAVCRHWRNVAIEYPAVWTTLDLSRARVDVLLLEELLRRSRGLPVSLELTLTTAQDVALRDHMPHVSRLSCAYAPSEELLRVPAPLLQKLVVRNDDLAVRYQDDLLCIPDDFGAPNLRALRAGVTQLPAAARCPGLRNLQKLTAIFGRAHDLTQALALCPRLVQLTVTCIEDLAKDAAALFQQPLPAHLVSLTVNGGALGPADYAQSLRVWHGRRFERLELSQPEAISGLLELFVRSHALPWAMELYSAYGDTTVVCRTAPPAGDSSEPPVSTFIITVPTHPHPQSALRGCEAHLLGRLADVTLSADKFFKCVVDGLSLPMVTSLTVNVIPNFWSGTMRRGQVLRGLEVPALRTLSFNPENRRFPLSEDILEWFCGVLPAHLREWLKYEASLLSRLALGGYTTGALDPARLSGLAVELSLPLTARTED